MSNKTEDNEQILQSLKELSSVLMATFALQMCELQSVADRKMLTKATAALLRSLANGLEKGVVLHDQKTAAGR